MSASTSVGARPTLVGTASPVRMRRFRPATRTMKNSSRLLAKMARKLARSSSGMLGSSAEFEHPLVEREPAQLAVEEPVGRQRPVVDPGRVVVVVEAVGDESGVVKKRLAVHGFIIAPLDGRRSSGFTASRP